MFGKKNPQIIIGKSGSLALAEAVGQSNIKIASSPVNEAKSIKNEAELEGFRQSHLVSQVASQKDPSSFRYATTESFLSASQRDGAALCSYFAWLEEQLAQGAKITESQGSDKLEEYRS